MSDALDHLAARVDGDAFFLGNALGEYARSEQLDDVALAMRLGLELGDLTRLRLCRSPRPETTNFRTDLTMVATTFGIDPAVLADAVRHGEGLVRIRQSLRAMVEPGHLLAARDGEREPPQGEVPS